MNYSHIINEMTWSYSRITTFEDCHYCFLLKYIKKLKRKERKFFADYGSFIHLIIQKYLTGELKKDELVGYYLIHFRENVVGKAPTYSIFQNYFKQGINYLKNIEFPEEKIVGIEEEVLFNLDDKNFIGFIDKISERDGVVVTDNKSRDLKERTGRTKPTKSDKELDKYLRQLYIYSMAIEQKYGVLPKELEFNCFRTQKVINEPFDMDKYEKTKEWARKTINDISKETEWNPNVEWFRCKYLCDVCNQCEYYQMFGDKAKSIGGDA